MVFDGLDDVKEPDFGGQCAAVINDGIAICSSPTQYLCSPFEALVSSIHMMIRWSTYQEDFTDNSFRLPSWIQGIILVLHQPV